jgi:citrate lyase subunit beta/citryl-CoA lyase
MRLRSLLFVPGDSERKFARASECGADGLILDLEDAVAPGQKPEARRLTARRLQARSTTAWSFWVRVNSWDTGLTDEDLSAVVRPGLDGVLLPKANGAQDVVRLAEALDRLEADAGMSVGSTRILVVATETPVAMFNLGSYAPAHPRLVGLTWGAEDLSAAIGAATNKTTDGEWTHPYQLARSLCLFAAAAAEVAPIETLYADFRDPEGLAASCRTARRDGFTGRIAIHPDQVAIINAGFTPSADDVAQARKVVSAFAAQPDAGTVGIDGQMYDIPHLKAARRVLAALEEAQP